MTTPNENPNVSDSPIFDPFPEPQTMPSGWDLSGINPEPGQASAESAGEAAEG